MIISSPGGGIEVEISPSEKRKYPYAVLAHPHPRMGGTMKNKVVDQLFRRGQEKGWGMVRFNFRGAGESAGEYDHGAGETDDVLAVLGWALDQFSIGYEELSLVGYSFGSWVGAKAAATLPTLKRLILIAPPIATMDFSVLAGVRHPKHVFAAGNDEFCPKEKLDEWFSSLLPPKTLRVIDQANHFFDAYTVELTRGVLRALDSN